ncbi:unnamed protein product [Choristocarpus tenellus]
MSEPVEAKGHSGEVIAVEYIPTLQLLVTSGAKEGCLRCWEIHSIQELQIIPNRRQGNASEPQVMLKWLSEGRAVSIRGPKPNAQGSGCQRDDQGFSNRLISGGASGGINIWEVSGNGLHITHHLTGHTDAVTAACIIPQPDIVVSGGMDADLRVWETSTRQCKRVLKGHSKGVSDIDYSPSQRIIVSAGFDHDILVWSPVVGQVICQLTGHTCSLVGIGVSQVLSEMVSMSVDGVIKVWDTSNFKCVQTLHAAQVET